MRQGLLPTALALALLATGCAGPSASTPAGGQAVVPITPEAMAAEARLATAIAIGQANTSISGTIESPVSLKDLPNMEDGRPPVYLHAFKTTGELIRDAQVAVLWKDDKTVSFMVDNVPADYPTVLSATIEPGIVMRAVIPAATKEKPAMAQSINAKSEMVVRELTAQGVMPPVAVGGLGSVLAQGGLNPTGAADEAEKAAVEMEAIASSSWGADIPEAKQLATDLRAMAKTYRDLAAGRPRGYVTLADCPWWNLFCHIGNAVSGSQKVQQKVAEKAKTSPPPPLVNDSLTRANANLGNTIGASVVASGSANVVASGSANVVASGSANVVASGSANVVASGSANVVASGSANVVASGSANVVASGSANVVASGSANVVSAGSANVVASGSANMFVRTFKSSSSAVMNIADLYQDGKALAAEKLGLAGPNGKAFTEAEIAQALTSGKGPYRQRCEDASFDGSRQNCTVVVNPMGTQEVLITRKIADFETFIKDFQAAHKAGDTNKAKDLLAENVKAYSFVFDDKRWTSPVGTWRVRLLQDAGNSTLPAGYSLLSDSELTIEAPGASAEQALANGTFKGLISAWLPNAGSERLDTFAMQFDWDGTARTLKSGLITGEERGPLRVLRKASFEATMDSTNTRITGTWVADDKSTSGRFEMIRGTAAYGI